MRVVFCGVGALGSLAGERELGALAWRNEPVVPVAAALLNAVPEGPPLAAPAVPGLGGPSRATFARAGQVLVVRPQGATPHVSLVEWLRADPDALRRSFARLYVPRNDGRRLRLNALVAAGNAGGDGEREAVSTYLEDPDETTRELAAWALQRMDEQAR